MPRTVFVYKSLEDLSLLFLNCTTLKDSLTFEKLSRYLINCYLDTSDEFIPNCIIQQPKFT